MGTVCAGVSGDGNQMRAFNVCKSKSAGDLIAELKAHSGVASLRKVPGLRSSSAASTSQTPAERNDVQPQSHEFKRVTLRHVNTALP